MDTILPVTPLLLVSLFLSITFIFSIGEKLGDWKGTVAFYTQHFTGTFIARIIPTSLVIVLLLELITVVFFILGFYKLILFNEYTLLFSALLSCATTILVLLIGQRFAKDYPGAMSLGVYFIITILGIITIP